MNVEATTQYHSRALDRGLSILDHLARTESGADTLAGLHAATGLPKSTLLRLLAVLERRGFVRAIDNGGRWRLGHAVVDLAASYRKGTDLGELAAPYLDTLSRATNQTANLGILEDASVLHVMVQEPPRPLRFRSETGSRDAVHCTGLGKMLLAGLPEDQALALISRVTLERRTPRTLTTVAALMEDVTRTRARGHAIDDEEGADGVCCLAVPVRASDQEAGWQASISLSGPVGEMTGARRDALVAELLKTAAALAANGEFATALAQALPDQTVRSSSPAK